MHDVSLMSPHHGDRLHESAPVDSLFLDDEVRFINENHYQEYAHPYPNRICDTSPEEWVKIRPNDAEVNTCPIVPLMS